MPTTSPYNPRRHFGDLLHAEMAKDPRVWALSGDLGYKVFDPIMRDFPDRFVNVGAAEQLLLGAGVGLALEGKIPVLYTITPFYLRAFEWLRNYLDHEGVNVKLVGSGMGTDYAHDGFSHHIHGLDELFGVKFFGEEAGRKGYLSGITLHSGAYEARDLAFTFRLVMDNPRPCLLTLRR